MPIWFVGSLLDLHADICGPEKGLFWTLVFVRAPLFVTACLLAESSGQIRQFLSSVQYVYCSKTESSTFRIGSAILFAKAFLGLGSG